MVAGQNGILKRAQEAKAITAEKAAGEKVDLAVSGAIARSNYGELTIENLEKEVEKHNGRIKGDKKEFPVTVIMDGYEIGVNGSGNVTKPGNKISKDESYVGYYADMDVDGTVDGVIYADLAIGGSGNWEGNSDGKYEIPQVTDGLKEYYISQTNYSGKFGDKAVISPTSKTEKGTERFYIMALTDIDGSRNGTRYDWYNAAYGKMEDYEETTSENFGTGKTNTATIIEKWNNKRYGEQNADSTFLDMWGVIQKEVEKGWFVPSIDEWVVFGDELKVDTTNYSSKDLSDSYWSSSQFNDGEAWNVDYYNDFFTSSIVDNSNYVRLSATF